MATKATPIKSLRRAVSAILLLAGSARAVGDPSATFCTENGGSVETRYDPGGGQYGLCVFPDGSSACDTWAFFGGGCAEGDDDFSTMCAANGGTLANESVDWGNVQGEPEAAYGICTLPDGECVESAYYGQGGCAVATLPPTGPTMAGGMGGGMGNPSSVFCSENGGTEENRYSPDGGEYGVCVFPDGSACDTWAFFGKKCAMGNANFTVMCADNEGQLAVREVDFGAVEGEPAAEYEACSFTNLTECVEAAYYGQGCFPSTLPPTEGTTQPSGPDQPPQETTGTSTTTAPDTTGTDTSDGGDGAGGAPEQAAAKSTGETSGGYRMTSIRTVGFTALLLCLQ